VERLWVREPWKNSLEELFVFVSELFGVSKLLLLIGLIHYWLNTVVNYC
jgi:hypothetical protein